MCPVALPGAVVTLLGFTMLKFRTCTETTTLDPAAPGMTGFGASMDEAVKGAGEAMVGVAVAPVWTVTVICEISGIPPAAFTGMQAGKIASSPARTNVNIFLYRMLVVSLGYLLK